MVIESTETQLRRWRRLADMADVAPTNADAATITLPANTLLVSITVCF